MASMDDTALDLRNAIADTEEAIEREWRRNPSGSRIPGLKLGELLQKWGDEAVYTDEDLDAYRGELWLSLAQYEEQLKAEAQGHDAVLRAVTARCDA